MFNWGNHPDEGHLLRFCDGELRGREASRVARHLEACWACRTQVEDVKKLIGDYVHYRKDVLQRSLPAPPQPWGDLRHQFDIVQVQGLVRKRSRVLQLFRDMLREPSAWMMAAAASILMAVGVYVLTDTPAVQAAELLKRAVKVERLAAAQKPHSQIHVRTRDAAFNRSSVLRNAKPEPVAQGEPVAMVAALFTAAHYDWQNPLSAEAFASWRDQLPAKQDEVNTTRDNGVGEVYQIHTTSPDAYLSEATIYLRKTDLHAVRERLEFQGREWVELTEDSGADANTIVPPPVAQAPHTASPPAVAQAASPEDELNVIAALHRAGADLGDPVEVVRKADRVVVTAVGLDPKRTQQLRASLAGMPRVLVQFSDSRPASPAQPDAGTPIFQGRRSSPWQDAITKQLGGPVAYQSFVDSLLENSDAMMARAHALRRLAERFPADVEAQLTPDGRTMLASIRGEHAAALSDRVRRIDGALRPVLEGLGVRIATVLPPTEGGWQARALGVFASAEQVDRSLGMMFAAAGSDAVKDSLPAGLAALLGQLDAGASAQVKESR